MRPVLIVREMAGGLKEDGSDASLLSKDEGYNAISPRGGCISLSTSKS